MSSLSNLLELIKELYFSTFSEIEILRFSICKLRSEIILFKW